jgi:hypothetical protein
MTQRQWDESTKHTQDFWRETSKQGFTNVCQPTFGSPC